MAYGAITDELRTHSAHVDALKDRIGTGVDAASTVVMDTGAYGIICSFLPPIVTKTTTQDATDALKSAAEGFAALSDNVHKAAAAYDEQEETYAAPFKKEMRTLDTGRSA